jgi:hypothetical protein
MRTDPQPPDGLARWLAFAPKPPPLTADKQKWHTFISYRSVNRAWVLHLYDALEQAGFSVFLDQFELVPGEALTTSLQSALEQSASGFIVWSTENQDSAWCQAEYNAMHTLRHARDAAFRFVIVKLDHEELPLFARNTLYEDFSESPEGPRGYGLLRVMCGLVGQPPSPGAITFATQIDQETHDCLAEIAAAKDIGDIHELIRMTARTNASWWASPLLLCQVAQALIDLGNPAAALDVLEPAEQRFPKSIRPPQLRALALARLGQWSAAQPILATLYQKGHRDPETLGIYARTWFDRYQESQRPLHLEKSRDLYAEAFKHDPQDCYTGINAASKSVFLGELDVAMTYAREVQELVGKDVVAGDYWKTATVGENQLILENYMEAARLYRAAVRIAPEALGNHDSTLGQARRLMDSLNTPPEHRARIEAAFS